MNGKNYLVGMLAAACLGAMSLLMPSLGNAQSDPRVQKSMELLKSMTAKLGAPKIEGEEAVGGKNIGISVCRLGDRDRVWPRRAGKDRAI